MSDSTAYRHYLDKINISFIAGGNGCINTIPEKTCKCERLLFLSSGELTLHTSQGIFNISSPYFILISANANIAINSFNCDATTLFWTDFNLECGNTRLFEISNYPVCAFVTDAPKIILLFKNLLEPDTNPLTGPLKQKSALLKIITSYLNLVEDNIKYENCDPRITSVLEYIDNNINKDIKIEELSLLVHMHPNYFIRFFKSRMGMPPIAYISNARLDRARRLLKETSMPVSIIAADVGIPDCSYFLRQFKKRTGYTPSQYRRLMQIESSAENKQ